MKINFTFHDELRLKKSKLSKQEVTEAVRFPDKTIKKHGKYYYQKRLERGIIEVVAEITEDNLNIITIYWL